MFCLEFQERQQRYSYIAKTELEFPASFSKLTYLVKFYVYSDNIDVIKKIYSK